VTQLNQPGYPLPDGELGNDEIVCQLIFLPDRSEYWQALLGAISYMSTWKAWERDSDKRGKDAAANWREAFELTMECWRMTCLEDLTTAVTDILELLQTKKDCCDDNITYLPTEEIETDIEPNVGDPPEYYGETEIADWDEWSEHVCYNAHKYVDYLAHVGDTLWDASESSSIFIGLIAGLLSLLAFSGIGLPIAFGLAAAIVAGIVLTGTITTFLGTKDAIEDARQSIVCAIVLGTSLRQAVEDALESGIDWDLFFQFIDYDSAIAIIYDGGFGGEFLPSETSEVCDCEFTYELRIDGPGVWSSPDRVESEWYTPPGCHGAHTIRCYRIQDDLHVPMTIIAIGTLTPVTCAGYKLYRLWEMELPPNLLWDSDTPPTNIDDVGSIAIVRNIPFTNCLIEWEPYLP
jgi:hypothetical protein